MVIPLHVKSHHSLAYGTASVGELVARAAENRLPALGLTDIENLYGQIQFHHASRACGLKPITGVELRAEFDGTRQPGERRKRLVLLARDRAGYASVCRIVSRRRSGRTRKPQRRPMDPVETIVAEALAGSVSGLFVLTDDLLTLERLLGSGCVNPADIGALVVRPSPPAADRWAASELETSLIEAARRHAVRLVADPDIVMLERADHPLHLLQLAVGAGKTLAQARSGPSESGERHFRSVKEIADLFHDLPDAVAASHQIAAACHLDLTRAERIWPVLDLPPGETPDSVLARRCEEALEAGRREGIWSGEEYELRLGTELATIRELGFSTTFLVVAEIVRYSRENGILITGRGSAVASLVAHLLGATNVDPVSHGLLFERLMHESRRDLPDIDLDVPSNRRDELIGWVFRRFGEDKVAMVSAQGTFLRRSAYREGLKALGMPLRQVENTCRRLPRDDVEDPTIPAVPEPYRRALPLIERLVGMPHYFAVHPGGVVIADRRIDDYVPLERAAKGVLAAQYDMRSMQHTGLVKIDLLGNRCLDELAETLSHVRAAGEEASRERVARHGLGAIPDGDAATLSTLQRADTIGCFQFETPAMRSLLAQLPIRDVRDCIAALALIRPGAAAGDAKRAFIRRAHGEEPYEHLDPRLERRLAQTHGVLLYEEDIMCVLSVLGGISLTEADALRAQIHESHDEPETRLALERRFLALTAENGIEQTVARRAWNSVLRFASYSFSKAHAASYGLLGYQAVYMKTHFPVEFGCAVLNHHGGMYPLRTLAAAMVRGGVRLLPPSINRSDVPCSLELGARGSPAGKRLIRVGLGKLKRLPHKSLTAIVGEREAEGPYRDVADLLRRVKLSKPEFEALVLSGACDELPPLSRDGYPFVHEAVLEVGGNSAGRALVGARDRLAAASSNGAGDGGAAARLRTYRSLVRIKNELTFLEMHVSDHPMGVLRSEAERSGCVPTTEAATRVGDFVRVAAVLAASRRVLTRESGVMQFLTLEDELGVLEAVLFPPVYRSAGSVIKTPGPFLVAGTVQEDHGDVHLVVSSLKPFHERRRPHVAEGAAG